MTDSFRDTRRSMALLFSLILLAGTTACDPARDDLARFWERTPGVWLGGAASGAPGDWSDVNEFRVAKLATYSPFPYVVTVGYAGSESGLYVMAVPDSTWLERFRAEPRVEMRIGESRYPLTGVEIQDPQEIRLALAVYSEKYQDWLDSYFGVALDAENLREYLVPIRFASRP